MFISEKPTLPFLGSKSYYKNAKYVIQPCAYEDESSWKLGAKDAPFAILQASSWMEDYNIETDSQAVKAGICTQSPFYSDEQPEVMVENLQPIAKNFFTSGKIPCFIGGDHSISIGSLYALKDMLANFSVLQLDSHTDLRASYNGSPYSPACVMRRAKECTDSVVQCGIRTMSNREKTEFNPDTIFFAQDIHQGGMWVDDVICELKDQVYVTIDMSVFDPSLVSSKTPEPEGLKYSQVMNLLKEVAKTKNVIGFDVVGLYPMPGSDAPQFMAAKMIYQFISYMEAFSN